MTKLTTCTLALALLTGSLAAQGNYTIRKLTCAGLDHGVAWDIDNSGNIVGEMFDAGGISRAVVWRNGVGEQLALLPSGHTSVAYTIGDDEF